MRNSAANKSGTALQKLCRMYLSRLRYVASKHGLRSWIDNVIKANERGECESTQREVEMLARMLGEDRISRSEICTMMETQYRKCCENKVFEKIKRIKDKRSYSRVSAVLYAARKRLFNF